MKTFLLLLSFLLIGCGVSDISESPALDSSAVQIENQSLETKEYTAQIVYAPIRYSSPALITRLKSIVETEKRIFFDDPGLEEVKNNPSLRPWNLHISTKPIYESEKISSYLISIYIDSGGAHGNGYYQVLNFDHKNADTIELTEIFDTQKGLEILSEKMLETLESKIEDRDWLLKGTAPTIENYQYWNYTPVGILVTFPPYQVGPYVIGSQSALIEKSYIEPYLSSLGKRLWGNGKY